MLAALSIAAVVAACAPAMGPATAESAPPAATAPPSPPAPHLDKNTPVEIEIIEPLKSSFAQGGQMFDLRLAEPIMYEGRVVVPAGILGRGEVIDAHRPGIGGRPGELILAARYLNDNGVRIPLKALRFTRTGQDNGNLAMAVSAIGGMAAIAIPGGDVEVKPGMHVFAKLAADVDLASLPPVPGAPAPTPTPAATAP